MKFFGRTKQKPVIPPELQPYYADRYGSRTRKYGVVALVIVVILIILGLIWWFGFHSRSTSDTSGSNTSKQASPAVQSPQDNKVLKQDNGKPAKTPLSGETTKKTAQ
jgi:cytoskeletal protein RodZ